MTVISKVKIKPIVLELEKSKMFNLTKNIVAALAAPLALAAPFAFNELHFGTGEKLGIELTLSH